MENKKEYEFGSAGKHAHRGPGGPGGFGGPGRQGGGEKAKDFIGTWKKIFSYFSNYTVFIIIALACCL